ncbi:MAG: hypothetical protein IE925_01880 [Rhodobacterales bacterium]|nr:hypothetical protein [Rhodobacterales bacterium]
MRAKPERILSGFRALRLVRAGGVIVRDGAAFRVHQRTDGRSRRCGRVPAHVVVRLKAAQAVIPHRGDPDRLVRAGGMGAMPALKPLPVPQDLMGAPCPSETITDILGRDGAQGIRLRAAAGRFLADYHLAASAGRLRTETPKQLAAARARLEAVEAELGPEVTSLIEGVVLDRFTRRALFHAAGAGLAEAQEALVRLAGLYGLLGTAQDAGRAFASA